MSEQHPDRERVEKIEIAFELPPSPQGTYQYEGADGTVVNGDASGEWTLDEHGEVDDIVFFMSAGWQMSLQPNTSSPPWRGGSEPETSAPDGESAGNV